MFTCHLKADTASSLWSLSLMGTHKRELHSPVCALEDASRRTWPPSCRTIAMALDIMACQSATELLVERQGRAGRTASSEQPIRTVSSPFDTYPLFRARDVNIGRCVLYSLLPPVLKSEPFSAHKWDKARSPTDVYLV